MSGIDEILPWALENFDTTTYDNFSSWLIDISNDFELNGRLPIREIFDAQDLNISEKAFNADQKKRLRKSDIQKLIDEF